jgi:hypothetical protein
LFAEALDHAEHDGADKGKGEIRGDNAQFTDESHGRPPRFTSLPVSMPKASKPFPAKKVSLAALSPRPDLGATPATWLKNSENNALKSP